METFTFKLILSGLMAFVPNPNGQGLTILLPEPSCESPHEARLTILKGSVSESAEPDCERDPSCPSKECIKIQSKYDLSIVNAPANARPLRYWRCRMMSPKSNIFMRRICLLSFDELVPGEASFNEAFLKKCSGESCVGLRNRIFFGNGVLRPEKAKRTDQRPIRGRQVVWVKGGLDSKKEEDRWAAEAMVYTGKFSGDKLELKLVAFGASEGGSEVKTITLKPKDGKILVVELDFSPSVTNFCNCNGSRVPSTALDHLNELYRFYSNGSGEQSFVAAEIMSLSERMKIRNECREFCDRIEENPLAAASAPVICYSAEIKP